MPNIVVLIKQVPDYESDRKLDENFILDRESVDKILDETNERAVEEALKIKEAHGGEVTVLCAGPASATEAIRRALSMGADKGVHLQDDGMLGSDVVQTGWALANALGQIEGTEIVICGNQASDGGMGGVPAVIAEYLGLPALTHMGSVEIDGDVIRGRRETDEGVFTLEASLPAVVSVGEKINEPRFPSFKGIMAAKKKPIDVVALADVNVEAGQVGVENAGSTVLSATPRPPKQAGERITNENADGGEKILEFLVGQKIV